MSTFPQVETGGPALARQNGIAEAGPRYLLPIELAKKFGALNFDVEAGYYFSGHGPWERILGLVVGRPLSERLELDAELMTIAPTIRLRIQRLPILAAAIG